MVMPMAARVVAAMAGGLLVLTALSSVVGTLMVPRPVGSWLTRWVDKIVNGGFRLAANAIDDKGRRDRLLATQAPVILLGQLAAWLGISLLGYALLFWPFASPGITDAFTLAGSSMFTLGFAAPSGSVPAAIVFAAAATGLIIVTLQIAYLPTLYAAFNRRETEVALLNARAGASGTAPAADRCCGSRPHRRPSVPSVHTDQAGCRWRTRQSRARSACAPAIPAPRTVPRLARSAGPPRSPAG